MRLRVLIAFLTIAASNAHAQKSEKVWLGPAGQRTKATLFRSTDAGQSPILIVVLHGDLDTGGASPLASKAVSQIHGVIAAGLVRPGYKDEDGDTSEGVMGKTSGDNYTPEVVNQLDAAIRQLKDEFHPAAVILVGHSGGATIAADLIAQDNGLAKAALLLSCPCDVPAWRKHMNTLRPNPTWDEPVTSISPMSVVDKISPKTTIWMMVGDKDEVAPPEFTEGYAAALRRHGIEANVTVLPGRGHDIIFDSAAVEQLSAVVAQIR